METNMKKMSKIIIGRKNEKFVAFKEIGHISKTININKNGIRKTSGNCENKMQN